MQRQHLGHMRPHGKLRVERVAQALSDQPDLVASEVAHLSNRSAEHIRACHNRLSRPVKPAMARFVAQGAAGLAF